MDIQTESLKADEREWERDSQAEIGVERQRQKHRQLYKRQKCSYGHKDIKRLDRWERERKKERMKERKTERKKDWKKERKKDKQKERKRENSIEWIHFTFPSNWNEI